MLPKLEYLRQARVKLGITQRKLASMAGVSTSMINQIESGRCKPSYETAVRIFDALNSVENQISPKAGDICTPNVISVRRTDPLTKAIEVMRSNGFSQLPVLEGETPQGLVTEDGILRQILAGTEKQSRAFLVSDVMEASPPVIDKSTPAKTLVPLVKFSKAVLVSDRGRILGIVTASDILKLLGPIA